MKSLIKNIINKCGYNISKGSGDRYLNALKNLTDEGHRVVIFDVGAHHGESEKNFLQVFDDPSIFCFEPFNVSFSILQRSVSKNTKIFNIGFSNSSGMFEFESNFFSPTNSLLPLEKNAELTWGGVEGLSKKESVYCQFTTVDEFLLKNSIDQVDILKLDVQGAEYKVIEGAKKSLIGRAIKNIYMECIVAPTYVGQWSIERYISEMSSYGYYLYGFYNMIYDKDEYLLQTDIIFTASK